LKAKQFKQFLKLTIMAYITTANSKSIIKKIDFLKSLLILLLLLVNLQSFSQVKVRGYYRKNGTYVQPHQRSKPDGNPYNNYSYPGNTNPHTGKVATGNPETYLKNYNARNKSTNNTHSYQTATLSPVYNSTNTNSTISNQPIYFVTINSLNVKSGPSSNYATIESLSNGSNLTVTEHYSNGWKKIRFLQYNNQTNQLVERYGYVSGQYIKCFSNK
jgi:hypothetical protein